MNKMSEKTEAALKTIALALITAPAGEHTEAGEMTQGQLEKLKGVGLPQIKSLTDRGILTRERRDTYVETEGQFAGQTFGGVWVYSIA